MGSGNTEASLFVSRKSDEELEEGKEEERNIKDRKGKKKATGEEDERKQKWWVGGERVTEQNLHP